MVSHPCLFHVCSLLVPLCFDDACSRVERFSFHRGEDNNTSARVGTASSMNCFHVGVAVGLQRQLMDQVQFQIEKFVSSAGPMYSNQLGAILDFVSIRISRIQSLCKEVNALKQIWSLDQGTTQPYEPVSYT